MWFEQCVVVLLAEYSALSSSMAAVRMYLFHGGGADGAGDKVGELARHRERPRLWHARRRVERGIVEDSTLHYGTIKLGSS